MMNELGKVKVSRTCDSCGKEIEDEGVVYFERADSDLNPLHDKGTFCMECDNV